MLRKERLGVEVVADKGDGVGNVLEEMFRQSRFAGLPGTVDDHCHPGPGQ